MNSHTGNPMSRRGRLFAGPILEHGICRALGDRARELQQMSAAKRASMVLRLVDEPCADADEAHACKLILTALSEIEAHEAINRIKARAG